MVLAGTTTQTTDSLHMNYTELPLVPPNTKHENFNWKFFAVFFFFTFLNFHMHVRIVHTSCERRGVEEERWWVPSLPSGVSSGQQSAARPWHHPLALLHDLWPRSISPWTWMLIWLLSQPAESQPDPDAISKRKYNEGTRPERMLGIQEIQKPGVCIAQPESSAL